MSTAQHLAEHRLLATAPRELVEELAARSELKTLAADELLFRTGEPAEHLYLIQSGRIALDLVGPSGPRLTVDTFGPDSLIGLSWLIPPYRWYLDARAVEPTTVLSLDGVLLRDSCDRHPELGYRLMQQVAHDLYGRMQSARVRLLDVYGSTGAR